MTPKVSVIIPLYNHEKYIRESVCSVLDQTYSDFELIIINDGSKDNSEKVVRNLSDKRIKYFWQDNQGAHNAINRGISLAKGEFICILNSDDLYYKERLEKCLKVFQEVPNIQAVFSDFNIINQTGEFIRTKGGAKDNWRICKTKPSFEDEDNILFNLLAGNFLATTTNLFCRKCVFDTIGNFANLRFAHDYDFFLRLCYSYPNQVYFIKEPLFEYRFHEANTINESVAAVNFEVCLVLSRFLLNADIDKLFPLNYPWYELMLKMMNSLNTLDTDKIMLPLLFFGLKGKFQKDEIFETLINQTNNSFRHNSIEIINKALQKHQSKETFKNSKANRLTSLFQEAKKDKKQFLFLPFRFIGLLLFIFFKKIIIKPFRAQIKEK